MRRVRKKIQRCYDIWNEKICISLTGHFIGTAFFGERELPAGRKLQEQGEHPQGQASISEQLEFERKTEMDKIGDVEVEKKQVANGLQCQAKESWFHYKIKRR